MNQLSFQASLQGRVNGQSIELQGGGSIDDAIGETIGDYELFDGVPAIQPFFLSACLITGYPNASASQDGVKNIFQGVPYYYRRVIRFRSGEELVLNARCDLQGNKLISFFDIQGTAPTGEVFPIEPLVESWEPVGPGRIRGHFTAAWKKQAGGYAVADAVTDYTIDTQLEQKDFLHRYVSITSTFKGNRLFKKQNVVLSRELCSFSS